MVVLLPVAKSLTQPQCENILPPAFDAGAKKLPQRHQCENPHRRAGRETGSGRREGDCGLGMEALSLIDPSWRAHGVALACHVNAIIIWPVNVN